MLKPDREKKKVEVHTLQIRDGVGTASYQSLRQNPCEDAAWTYPWPESADIHFEWPQSYLGCPVQNSGVQCD